MKHVKWTQKHRNKNVQWIVTNILVNEGGCTTVVDCYHNIRS